MHKINIAMSWSSKRQILSFWTPAKDWTSLLVIRFVPYLGKYISFEQYQKRGLIKHLVYLHNKPVALLQSTYMGILELSLYTGKSLHVS